MKEKIPYEELQVDVLNYEEDIITSSNDYDDKGSWNDGWFK